MSLAKGTAKSAGILVIVALFSKVLGFGREQAIAYQFGASYLTDAYYVASLIPLMIFSLINGALRSTLIPIFVEYLEKKGKKEAFKFANNVLNIVMVVLLVMVLGGYFFAPFLIKVVAPGFEGKTYLAAVNLTKIMIIVIVFLGLAGIATGILNSFKDFIIPAIVGLPQNIIIIISILVLGKTMGIYGLAIGMILGIASQLFLQLPALKKHGMSWQFTFNFCHPGIKKMGILVFPIFLGASVNQINIIIDRMLASGLPEGSISALNFASRLNALPLGLFTSAIVTVLFPTLAQVVVNSDYDRFKEVFYSGIKTILFFTVPITVGFILLGGPIIQLLFQRGAFTYNDTLATAYALQFYAIGLIAISLREFMDRVYLSFQDTILPVITGVIGLVINIVLNLILIRYLAHGGLALGTSISAIVNVAILFVYLPKKVGHIEYSLLGRYVMKVLAAAGIMGAAIYAGDLTFPNPQVASVKFQVLKVGGLIGLGTLLYFVMAYFLKIEELHWLQQKIMGKIYRRLNFQVSFFRIDREVPKISTALQLELFQVNEENLKKFPNFREPTIVEQFHQMLAQGQRGFFAVYQEQVINHAWVMLNLGSKPMPLTHYEIPPHSAYIHFCSTREDMRGQGVFSWVLTKVVASLKEEYGTVLKGVYIDADLLNHASLRGFAKANFEPYAVVMDCSTICCHRRRIDYLEGSGKEDE